MNMKAIVVVMNTTRAVVKIRPEKDSDLYGILNHDLCDTGAVLYHGRNQVMGPNKGLKPILLDLRL